MTATFIFLFDLLHTKKKINNKLNAKGNGGENKQVGMQKKCYLQERIYPLKGEPPPSPPPLDGGGVSEIKKNLTLERKNSMYQNEYIPEAEP